MIKKAIAPILLLFISTNLFSQVASNDTIIKPIIKLSYLDSLKTTYVFDDMSTCVDALWMKEMVNNEVFKELSADIKNINTDQTVNYELPTELLKERLKLMDEKSPFNIEYNVGLENVIKSFLKNRKRSYERLMGISQYYFPIFEEAMARHNVPLEIKYLAIVESALNPKAVSRMGATGLWQFMYQTGKQYKLNIDSYVDERSDALKASDAAARYMKGMYDIFGDWELVLASYNSGAGNVTKAIRRSGGHQNFWNIKSKLPKETQGYVPAFLATMYIFEYHKEHGIVPNKAVANHLATDTIAIKSKMSFKQISELLDIPVEQIEFFNPSYKMNVVPYVTNQTHFLCLPKDKVAIFTSNEDKMYAYVNYQENLREKPFLAKAKVVKDSISTNFKADEALVDVKTTSKKVLKTKIHTVKRGDNLSDIANKYDVTMTELKQWNNMKSNKVTTGRKLKIITETRIAVVENVETKKALVANEEKIHFSKIDEKDFYTVKQGDNLTKIANEYNITVSTLMKWNNLKNVSVKLGDKLSISGVIDNTNSPKETEIIYYKIKKGDNITMIASKNNVSVTDLKLWNNLSSNSVRVGESLKIEKSIEAIADVKKDRKKTKLQDLQMYIVQKGDSLYSISKKHHVTVSDIKKLNDITDESIQPGMELKIKG